MLFRLGRIDLPTVVDDLCSSFYRWSRCRVRSLSMASSYPLSRYCLGISLPEQVLRVLLALFSGGNSASLAFNSVSASLQCVFYLRAELGYPNLFLRGHATRHPPNLFLLPTTEQGVPLFSPSCELRSSNKLVGSCFWFIIYISRNQRGGSQRGGRRTDLIAKEKSCT